MQIALQDLFNSDLWLQCTCSGVFWLNSIKGQHELKNDFCLYLYSLYKHGWQTWHQRSHNLRQDQVEEDGDSREKHTADQREYVLFLMTLIQDIFSCYGRELFELMMQTFFFSLLAAIEQEKTES